MFEAYSVGVRISVINGAAAGLLGLSRQFKTAGLEAAALNRQIAGIKRTLLIGGGMAAAGVGILAMFKPALDQAKQFQLEAAKFSSYGMGDAMTAQAIKFAKGANIVGASYTDMMRLINESQGIFRESGALSRAQQFAGARVAAPVLAKLNFIESALSGDKRTAAHAQDLAMLRFIEARGGANDPSKFVSIADWGFKLSKSAGATHGPVDWSQLQQFTATAGAAGFNLTQDAIAKLEPVLADMKGGRSGSGLRVSFQRMLGTQRGLPRQAVDEFLSLGLWDRSKVELSAGGGIKRFRGLPGSVLNDRDKLATDPEAYYEENFLPAIAKKYGRQILGDTVQARTQRAAEISMVFGPGTAGAMYSQIDKLLPAIHRSVAAQRKQLGIDDAAKVYGDTLIGKQIRMQKDLENILESTGEVVLPMVIKALNIINPLLEKFAGWANANPKKLGLLVDGLVKLGGVLTFLGGVVLAKGVVDAVGIAVKVFSGPIGKMLFGGGLTILGSGLELVGAGLGLLSAPVLLVIAGIAAVGVALYAIIKHWDATKGVFWNIKHELGMLWDWIAGKTKWLLGLIPGVAAPANGKPSADPLAPYRPHSTPGYTPPFGAQKQSFTGDVHMDGKKVGKVVWRHMNGDLARSAQSSGSSFDPTLSLSPVRASFA